MDQLQFLQAVNSEGVGRIELAVALLWFISLEDNSIGLTAHAVSKALDAATTTQQNSSRLKDALRNDTRVSIKGDIFRIRAAARGELNEAYGRFFNAIPIPVSNSLLPTTLFTKAKSYLAKTANSMNYSYESGLYDCASLMAQKLVENLIIEVYEAEGREDEIINGNGDYKMLNALIDHFLSDTHFHLQRGTKAGLPAVKKLGDLSAHARRYGAIKGDFAGVLPNLRELCDELLHLAGQNA
jgi:hypothetical protein